MKRFLRIFLSSVAFVLAYFIIGYYPIETINEIRLFAGLVFISIATEVISSIK